MRIKNSKTIFICNSYGRMKKILKSAIQHKTYYVNLDCSLSPGIEKILASLRIADLTKELFVNSSLFKLEFTHLMRELNNQNSSLEWWAMNFTNKNTLLSSLYNDIFYVTSLVKLIKKTDFSNLFVFSSNSRIAGKLKYLESALGINVCNKTIPKFNLKNILTYNLPVMILYSATKIIFRKILFKKYFNINKLTSNLYLIATQLENRSFKNFRFEDIYFKSLKEFFLSKGIKVMTVGFVNCKLKHLFVNKGYDVFPFEKFLQPLDILKLLFKNLKFFFLGLSIKDIFIVSGIDFTDFVNNEINFSIKSGQVSLNLAVYYSVLHLFREYYPKKVIYPFENRSWEKMIVLGGRTISKDIKLIGYQHASLTPKHINLYLEDGEYNEIPFPDEIITMGSITKDMMVNLLNFPPDKLKIGCALRQSLPKDNPRTRFLDKIDRILVVLASSIDEYVKVLKFLDSAFSHSQPYQLTIRPHPANDFKRALKLYKPQNIKYELDTNALDKSLEDSDLVIYVSSTVSLEAISIGVPVILVRINDVLSSDPLFNISFFKWNCEDPKELKNLIEDISKIDKAEFLSLQKKAEEFSRLYCVPATESSMEVFV